MNRHPADSWLDRIAAALAARRAESTHDGAGARPDSTVRGPRALAAVALVVRPDGSELDLLLVKRATVAGDPWSGHMALPGGRRAPEDQGSYDTAVRETREEVGLDLVRDGRLLGRLDDVEPRAGAPSIVVSPFVFAVPRAAALRTNHEVALALWVPFAHLADPASAVEHHHPLPGGMPIRFPAFGFQEHVIWGITHRIVSQFLEIARDGLQPGREP